MTELVDNHTVEVLVKLRQEILSDFDFTGQYVSNKIRAKLDEAVGRERRFQKAQRSPNPGEVDEH